jgi:hypothetical protein
MLAHKLILTEKRQTVASCKHEEMLKYLASQAAAERKSEGKILKRP